MDNMPTIEKYLINDVKGLMEVLNNAYTVFNNRFGIDIFGCMTSSSVSRKFFLGTHYQPQLYPLFKMPLELDSVIRQAYYGGRCECFQLGEIKGPIYYYDVTSEYPYVMLSNIPWGWPKYVKFTNEKQWKGETGIFKAKVKGKSLWGPNIIPWRASSGLVFPEFTDWQEGWWYSAELDTAALHGYDVIFIEGFVFETDTYLKESVLHLFKLKQEARANKDKSLEYIAKVMINSLYGFWAMRVQDITKLLITTNSKWDPALYFIETQSLLSQKRIHNTHILKIRQNLDVPYSYSPISIAVTALSRLYLWKIMSDIVKEGGIIYYCDTDSVITNYKMEGGCLEQKYMKNKGVDLGELKNEFGFGKSVEACCIIGPKIYGFIDPELPKEYQTPKLKGFYKRFVYRRKENIEEKLIEYYDPQGKSFSDEEHTSLLYKDLILLSQGWKISLSTWRFRSKVRAYFDDFEVRKEKINICFSKNYQKGYVDELDKIHPFKIKNSLII
jgi:hypothetical protein